MLFIAANNPQYKRTLFPKSVFGLPQQDHIFGLYQLVTHV